jgi:hypothetical protein
METQPTSDPFYELNFAEETKANIRELASFTNNPEQTTDYLITVITDGEKSQNSYSAIFKELITTAKTVLARGGNLLSLEFIQNRFEPAKYKQDETTSDRGAQMGKDLMQGVMDNRADVETSMGADDRWKAVQFRKGMHDAISDSARVSGYQNYDDNRVTEVSDEDLEEELPEGITETNPEENE